MDDENLIFGTIISIEDDLSYHCDFPLIANGIKKAIREVFEPIDVRKMNGWKINIIIVYKRARKIYLGKRGAVIPSEKTKEFFLRLAVPTLEQASYGFSKKKFEYDDLENEKLFFNITPDFDKYDSLASYFVDGARRITEEALKNGITINGEKLKLPSKRS